MFYDLETVPDESRFPRPEQKEFESIDCLAVIAGKVDDVKSAVESCTDEDLDRLLKLESSKDKPRKGVIDTIERERSNRSGEFAAWVKEGSVNPLWCRIAAAGWAVDDGDIESAIATNDDEERSLIETLLSEFQRTSRRCGYNILGFDDTVIGFRCALLGIDVPFPLSRNKFRNSHAIDLMQLLFPAGSPKKCKDVARSMELEVPAGDFDGSQVYEAYLVGDNQYLDTGNSGFATIKTYVESDVEIERELYRLFKGIFTTN